MIPDFYCINFTFSFIPSLHNLECNYNLHKTNIQSINKKVSINYNKSSSSKIDISCVPLSGNTTSSTCSSLGVSTTSTGCTLIVAKSNSIASETGSNWCRSLRHALSYTRQVRNTQSKDLNPHLPSLSSFYLTASRECLESGGVPGTLDVPA